MLTGATYRSDRGIEVMADFMKQHAADFDVASDRNSVERPRQFFDEFVDDQLNPGGLSVRSEMVDAKSASASLRASSARPLPMSGDFTASQDDCSESATMLLGQPCEEALDGWHQPTWFVVLMEFRLYRNHGHGSQRSLVHD